MKNKRALLIVLAVVFLLFVFFLKTKTQSFKNSIGQEGLVYENLTVGDLINKDTDGDGVSDWEEGLWATDPTKKDTNGDGTPDGAEIAKRKSDTDGSVKTSGEEEKNLTLTDRFGRELFSTVAALNQAGTVDQGAVDKLTTSLTNQIQNPVVRKVFLISDLKTSNDNSIQSFTSYNSSINNIYKKYPINGNAVNILQEFVGGGENVNIGALSKLDPIIQQTKKFIDETRKVSVPSELSQLHLDVINVLERLMENLIDVRFYDTDPVVAMGGMSKFEENTSLLQSAIGKITNTIREKLNN